MSANRPTAGDVLARARALAPVLFARAEEAERQRSCPAASVEDWFANGLDLAHKPQRFGGAELGWDVLCETGLALARGCAAQGWVLSIFGDHSQAVGMFPRRAQDEVWEDPRALVSTSFGNTGTARRVKGGAVLSGKWGFSSGIDHANWIIAGGMLTEDGSAPEPMVFLMPKADVSVTDDWYVLGLAGTGSKSFAADQVFVPEHRFMSAAEQAVGRPHPDCGNEAPLFRTPRRSTAALGLASIGVGGAQGMLAEFVQAARQRVSRGLVLAQEQWVQIAVAEVAAMLRAGELMLVAAARATMAQCDGGYTDAARRAEDGRDAAFAARLARQAADRLYAVAGGNSLYLSNPLQRYFRDVHAATAHVGLRWEHAAVPHARLALGLDPPPGLG